MDAPTKLLPGSPELVDIPGGKQPSDNWYHRASRSYMFGPAAIALVFFLVSLVVVSCALADYASRLERCRQLNITADNCDVEPILLSNVTVMDVIN